MSERQSTPTNVHDSSRVSLVGAQERNGQVYSVTEISAVLAFHPGKRNVDVVSEQHIGNGLTHDEISSRFDCRADASLAIQDGEDHWLLVGATLAYRGERFNCSADIITINNKAIDMSATSEFDGACRIRAKLNSDTRRTERSPDDI
jgi:hypothetical protein